MTPVFTRKPTTKNQQLFSNLSQLQTIRRKVDSLSIALTKAYSYFTQNNLIILDLNSRIASELEETNSSERFLTLFNIAYAKEQAGIERTVLIPISIKK